MTIDKKKRFIVNVAFIAVIALLIYGAMRLFSVSMLPFLIGFICALTLQKPVAYLSEKTRIPRGIWSLVLVVIVFAVLAGAIALAGYYISEQLISLVANLSESMPVIQKSFQTFAGRFSGWLDSLPQGLAEVLASTPGTLIETGISALSGLLTDLAGSFIVSIPNLILTSVISIVACCFITIDYYKITSFVLCQFSHHTQRVLIKAKRVFTENILKMLQGYILIIFITFFELFVGFLILDIPYAATLALIIAFVDILPVLGTGTVLIPWGVLSLIFGNTKTGIGLLVLYILITIIRNVIEPKIIGTQVGLPPIVTLICMYVGLQLFGFIGLWTLPILVIIISKLQDAGMIHIWKNEPPITAQDAEQTE